MIDLKKILGAMARTFGISSPEDLRKQKSVASKSTMSSVDSDKQSYAESNESSGSRSAKPAQEK